MATDNSQKETINSHPTPDSEKPEFAGDESRFDFDFNVAPSFAKKEEQNKDTPPEPVKKEEKKEEPPAKAEEKPLGEEAEEKPEEKVEAKPEPKVEAPPELIEQIQAKDTEISTLRAENEQLKNDVTALKNIQAAIDEIQKNPEVFMRKYFPTLAEKVSPYKMINDRLRQDPTFGPDFIFEPSEAYIEGTKSYEWRLREEEIKDQFRREELKLESQRLETQRNQTAKFNEDKAKVMKDFNLTESQFQKEIVEWAQKQPNSLYNVARLRYMDDMIKRAVEKTLAESKGRRVDIEGKPKAGAKDISGTNEELPEHLKELKDAFGDL